MTHVALKVKEFCDAFEAGHSEKYSNDVYEIYKPKKKIVSILINNGVTIFGMLPGSGALECDIGGFKDIIAPKRGLLDPGMVEVLLMVRLNKPLTEYDIGKIATLPCDTWQTKIPKGRPTLPTDYFAGEDAEQAAQQAAAEQTAVDCEEAQAQQAALEEESVGDSGE
mmetsp:Transcript_16268/g.21285  ORF Transcript_16268/g.21285 Transcript_16268/m.21285 type:complete len:167 (-) Transcript_16268:30-530(-)|eukprot:CAMPEP_0198150044 /NCGR_PEP_ID=MMETSP1443-20131203/49144_1 /TAXON_ID=186043 /ORGANISM="Entomoneis sp., Strain CCMP2396" /LENGTH=166 /DNA_ID=CAMNT_0043815235 /DNA_START=39 /DNA_END=539 /DNA_ORIENTATION=-